MHDLDFHSDKNKEQSLLDLKSLVNHPGWKIVKAIAEANIEFIKDDIISGDIGDTLETIARKRDKLKAYQDILKTPDTWIERLSPVEKTTQHEDDPY